MHVETQPGMSGELDREALPGDQRYVVNGHSRAVVAIAVLDIGSGPIADPDGF
jgi:hypothetical protein